MVKKAFFLIGILAPVLVVFKFILTPGQLAWGDAPYFYNEKLAELVTEPLAWTNWGNNLGGVNKFLWMSPLMILYGIVGSNLLFYFPSLILAAIGPIFLARYLKLSGKVQFFASLVYCLNTYFLLLIDGGVVGLGLAYGIFPFTILFLRRLADRPNYWSYLWGIIFLFILTVADPRASVISLLVMFLWFLLEKSFNKMLCVVVVGFAVGALSMYWIIPLVKLGAASLSLEVSKLSPVTLFDSLTLHQPHWPENIFGKVGKPPLYFAFVPLLIFSGVFVAKKKKDYLVYIAIFLLFAFIAKGSSPPLGGLYNWLVKALPFGAVFRDSTKFIVPVILFAGILIGLVVDRFKSKIFLAVVYFYLVFLIHPAIYGKLNFVLSGKAHSKDYQTIADKLSQEEEYFRTAWFPERNPVAFHTEGKPALDAKNLVSLRPLGLINAGSYDQFNYMNSARYLDYYRLLGIKYLIFSGEHRKLSLDKTEKEHWNNLIDLVNNQEELKRVDWEIDILVYEISDTMPRIFAVDKLYAVVGFELPTTSRLSAAIYFEDGLFDPKLLQEQEIDPQSVVIVFNGKKKSDLVMSFLQDYFLEVNGAIENNWKIYNSSDYLTWKYQLLIRGVDTKEFDYGKPIALSTKKDEVLKFRTDIQEKGEYVLAVRAMLVEGSSIDMGLKSESWTIESGEENRFVWFTKSYNLTKGSFSISLKNNEGLSVVNVVALIPKKDFSIAESMATAYISNFETLELDELAGELNWNWQEVNYEKVNAVRYKLIFPEGSRWIVFTDSFHPLWVLKRDQLIYKSVPLYSMINSFYKRPEWVNAELVFEGQKEVRWGLYWSAISLLLLAIIFLWHYPRGEND